MLSKKRNLLLISYYLPPTKTVATTRIFNFHTEAKKHLKKIFSLTTTNRQLFQKENYAFDDSNTIEIWTLDLRKFLNKKNNSSTGVSQKKKESSFAKFIIKLSYSFPFNLILADGALTYIWGGFFKGKKIIQEEKIQLLFSSYKPYSDHLICFLLKKWKPSLIWLADFRDLHVDPNRNNVFWIPFQKWCNKKILSKADIVTTVSKGLAKNLQQYHSNIYVLRNGIHQLPQEKESTPLPHFTITYTGSLYPAMQTAQPLLKVLQHLIQSNQIDSKHLQLVYAGKDGTVWKQWIENNSLTEISEVKGLVPLAEARQLQHDSHINLLLSWSSTKMSGTLTGKFYEYLAVCNSILLLINGTHDQEFEDIFHDTNAGMIAYHPTTPQKEIENFILNKYQEWLKTGQVEKPISIESLKPFLWETQMEVFMQYLDEFEQKKPI